MLKKDIQELLDNEETINKKIIIANNAYNCSELTLGHKEIILLKWIIKNSNQDYQQCWSCVNKWLKSTQFKKLNRNDISKEDFMNITELIIKELLRIEIIGKDALKTILDSICLLIDHEVFQHYFKYNVDIYCKLISSIIQKIDYIELVKDFLKMDLCDKNILVHEKFHKNFFVFVVPRLTECVIKFDNEELKECISKFVQKCLFYRNHKSFKCFIDNFFEDTKLEKNMFPKYLFKTILHSYNEKDYEAAITYKIIFKAFCSAYYADFEMIYKFFILLVYTTGFKLNDNLILSNKLELAKSDLCLTKSQEILLVLMEVLSENKNDPSLKINNISFTEFIRSILKQLLLLSSPSATLYKIFLKAIAIDALLIEPITDDVIISIMIRNSSKDIELYEILIIQIFDIYVKLRRVENFVSKMVHIFNNYFSGEKNRLEEVCKFIGKVDVDENNMEQQNIRSDNIFTDNVLQHFSRCIWNLASWQVINIFKTLLHQLQQTLINIDQNDGIINFMEILSVLVCTLLCSVRLADHSAMTNMVPKLVKELQELRNILKEYGSILLNRKHNKTLMRSFLNIAYFWAEVYISVEYYSIDSEIQLNKLVDKDCRACNVTYLHSYLTVKQWCLISERITNFGEVACKQLLEKLYIQKIRAMLLFENSVKEDVIENVIKCISANIGVMWKNILKDKYIINKILPDMDLSYSLFLAEKLLNNMDFFNMMHNKQHLTSSSSFITAVNYIIISKIDKALTKRRDKTEIPSKAISIQISSVFTAENFSSKEPKKVLENVKTLYYSNSGSDKIDWFIKEEKVCKFFQILQRFPLIYCSEAQQKLFLIYFFSLHRDISSENKQGNYKKLQQECEKVITGILQQCKFKLVTVFKFDSLCNDIVENFDQWEQIFLLVAENVFKDEYSIEAFQTVVTDFSEKLLIPEYMRCCVIIINILNKMKKLKISKDIKDTAENYKSTICNKMHNVVLENKPTPILIDGYCLALRHFLLTDEEEKLSSLLIILNSYVELALKVDSAMKVFNNLTLLITVLENKVKLKTVIDKNLLLKIWNVCKGKEGIHYETDKFTLLIKLIFGVASNEQFSLIISDLSKTTEDSYTKKEYQAYLKMINIWDSVLSCDLNPLKTKNLQMAVERLLREFVIILQQSVSNFENLIIPILNLQRTIIQTVHLPLTPAITDILILSVTILSNGTYWKNGAIFNLSISLLESLLKFRKPLIMDRLPSFLQLYRVLVKGLCENSNSNLNLEESTLKEVSDQSHQLEKLTKSLVLHQRDMARIAMYLISDILQQYEQVTLHPNIKIHLNNCIYSLLTVCDQHAIAFLMRALSSASTEIFKEIYENYKKFYRFTGKV